VSFIVFPTRSLSELSNEKRLAPPAKPKLVAVPQLIIATSLAL